MTLLSKDSLEPWPSLVHGEAGASVVSRVVMVFRVAGEPLVPIHQLESFRDWTLHSVSKRQGNALWTIALVIFKRVLTFSGWFFSNTDSDYSDKTQGFLQWSLPLFIVARGEIMSGKNQRIAFEVPFSQRPVFVFTRVSKAHFVFFFHPDFWPFCFF